MNGSKYKVADQGTYLRTEHEFLGGGRRERKKKKERKKIKKK